MLPIRLAAALTATIVLGTVQGIDVLPPSQANITFPPHSNVVDVTQAPYHAKGDGVTDDTDALQRAFNEHTGRHRFIYLPPGTYLVSKTLTWPKTWNGRENWGFTTLQGASSGATVIRLRDGTFTDAENPQAMLWCGGFGSADWFHNHVQNLTFNVGRQNPGAIGLQFYSNNYGAVRHCLIVSDDGQGAVGLDLAHRDMNGPLLVRRVEIRGFRRGVATGRTVNSQTIEHLTLRDQTLFGIDNEGQSLAIRGLHTAAAVTAVRSYGVLCLLDATLIGTGAASRVPALINYNGGRILLRDVHTSGYARALGNVATPHWPAALEIAGDIPPGTTGPVIAEYFSQPPLTAFPTNPASLRLPVQETPDPPRDDPNSWAVADAFGADPTGERDSADAIQRAADSGASTLFLPGHYALSKPVIIRPPLRHILGLGGQIDYVSRSPRAFRIEGGDSLMTIEHLANINSGIEVASDRPLILRSLGARIFSRGTGPIFFEDVAGHELSIKNQKLFARQLNIENEGTHFLNDGGTAWILGYKTERGGTLMHTRSGGHTELFGTFSYTTTAGKLAPMFITENSSVFAWLHEVCYSGDPFATLVRESRGLESRELPATPRGTLPYIARPE